MRLRLLTSSKNRFANFRGDCIQCYLTGVSYAFRWKTLQFKGGIEQGFNSQI